MTFALVFVGLDDRPEGEARTRRRQAGHESTQLVGVILRRQPPGEEPDLAATRQEAREQLAGDGPYGEWIGGDGEQARAVRRVGDDADDRDVAPGRLAEVGRE